jgi:hypothetical protein
MPYSIPYIILTIFFLFVFFVENTINFKQNSVSFLNFIVLLSFIFFFGFRNFVGWDWTMYAPFFKNLHPISSFLTQVGNLDWGFMIYASIIKQFSANFHLFVFFSTFLNACLLHVFFKRYLSEKFYALGFAVFLVFFGLILQVDLMRNIISLLLFLLSLKYIESRNFLNYLILNLIGLSFHWSSLVFFPLYFFLHKRISIKTVLIVFAIGYIVFLFRIHYIKPILLSIANLLGGNYKAKVTYYLASGIYGKEYALSFGFFERIVTSILVLINYNKLIAQNKRNILFLNAFFIYMISFLYFSEVFIAIARLGFLFSFSYWILWPTIIDYSSIRSTKYILLALFSCVIILKIHLMSNNILYNYENVIVGKVKTYDERLAIFKANSNMRMKNN